MGNTPTVAHANGRAALFLAVLASWLLLAAFPVRAQDSKLADGPPPPPEETAPPPATAAPAPTPAQPPLDARAPVKPPPAEPAAPPEPAFDPVHAGRSVDIGTFYMKKGDYDAAIDRFQEAARLQPGLAKPFLLMGEVYEKKDDSASAIAAYRKYLELYSTAPDRDKITKRIEKLGKRPERAAAGRGSG